MASGGSCMRYVVLAEYRSYRTCAGQAGGCTLPRRHPALDRLGDNAELARRRGRAAAGRRLPVTVTRRAR